jgi:hypothetical protein
MPAYKSIKALCANLQGYVNAALEEEVMDAVRETEQEKAIEVVYATYKASMYSRRGLDGGLVADENIVGTLLADGVLSVDNIAEFNENPPSSNSGWGLAGLVEYGNGWNGHQYDYADNPDAAYLKPRPFIESTADELADGSIIKAALRKGLRKNGLLVE